MKLEVIKTRPMTKGDLNDVVQIHIKAFQGFFLTLLGRNFLYDLYKNFILDEFSICIVAEKDTVIKGFVVGNLKPEGLFRKMLFQQGYLFLLHSVKALVKNPLVVFRKLLYALKYRGELPLEYANAALLSSVGVDTDEGSKGIGSSLVKAFCQEAFSKGSAVVYLTTDNINNENVNSFYIKNGFQLESIFEKTGGRKMNRYIKMRDEKIL